MVRLFDLLFSLCGVILLSPALLVIAAAVKFQDGGSVFYRALRTGHNGRGFLLLKFRTMEKGADKKGSGLTTANDPRVTPVGRLLRRYKLDELPQLINVIKGEMSLVGPRPEDPHYVAQYTAAQRKVLEFRPGITSPASLTFRGEESMLSGANHADAYMRDILPRKLDLELAYFPHRTIWTDVSLIVRTILTILLPSIPSAASPQIR